MSKYDAKESEELKQVLREIDVTGPSNHISFSIVVCLFLGSIYYFFRWKIVGALLLFFAGYGSLLILVVAVSIFVKKWGLKKIEELEENDHVNNDDLDF